MIEKENIKLYLAPMAGISDAPFRLLCQEQGADVGVTEMISAQGFICAKKTSEAYQLLTERHPDEKNVIVQIFGTKPAYFERAAKLLTESGRFCGIDINMGCPARKVTNGGAGSALMQDARLARGLVMSVKKATNLPVSVKIRLGFDSFNAPEFARELEEAGADMLTVHGRTRVQQYSGKADWEKIAQVRQSVSIPVVANGDVFTPEDAKEIIRVTSCRAVMIGRGALGNPWLFHQIKDGFEGKEIVKPSREELIQTALRHADMLIERKGEHHGIVEMRKHFAWYLKGLRGASQVRTKLNTVKSLQEVKEILYDFLLNDAV